MIDTTHPFDPKCSICQEARREGISHKEAMRRAQIRDAHYLEQVGWVVHVITDAPTAHTHGLEENYGHPDFQVWLSVSPRQRYELLAALAIAVKAGQRFRAGEEDRTVLSVPVHFVERREPGRRVLRHVPILGAIRTTRRVIGHAPTAVCPLSRRSVGIDRDPAGGRDMLVLPWGGSSWARVPGHGGGPTYMPEGLARVPKMAARVDVRLSRDRPRGKWQAQRHQSSPRTVPGLREVLG